MCQGDPIEMLQEWGVARTELTWEAMEEALRANGVSEDVVGSFVESGAAPAMVAMCDAFRDPLVEALRARRFGGGFAAAIRSDPDHFGAGISPRERELLMAAMLPHFDSQASEGEAEKREIIQKFGLVLASLQWGVMDDPDIEPDQIQAQGAGVVRALLDFMPRPAHAAILAVVDQSIVRAQVQGPEVFDWDYVDPEPLGGARSL